MATCDTCATEFPQNTGRGRKARFCSTACRMRAYRARRLPERLTAEPRWALADGKRPMRLDGRLASSTDPGTWTTYAAVRGRPSGIMLGSGLGCYDLDGVTLDEARGFAALLDEPVVFVERSLSGKGVHIFVEAPESRGWRRTIGGIKVERYTRARFIRVTGDRVRL